MQRPAHSVEILTWRPGAPEYESPWQVSELEHCMAVRSTEEGTERPGGRTSGGGAGSSNPGAMVVQ